MDHSTLPRPGIAVVEHFDTTYRFRRHRLLRALFDRVRRRRTRRLNDRQRG
ncbi:MAG: hypothetical protein R3290_08180 [Acidimicrobiia bacterium]|nr:hypothetical protein [Acidimicrobiia bacterium]